MEPHVHARCVARARIYKALGHPVRLFIVEELAQGEQCVCELTEKIGLDISTVSKHLSVLKGAGIIQDAKRGQQVFYTLRIPCVVGLFGCIEQVLKTDVQAQMALVETG